MTSPKSFMIAATIPVFLLGCQPSNVTEAKAPQVHKQDAPRPFHTPGQCRTIYVQSASPNGLLETTRKIFEERGSIGYKIALYELHNGDFAAATIKPRSDKTVKQRSKDIARYVKNGWYHPTARCSTGEDIKRDTGQRLIDDTKNKSGGLFTQVIVGAASAIANSGKQTNGAGSNLSCITIDADVVGLDNFADDLTILSGAGSYQNDSTTSAEIVCPILDTIGGVYQYSVKKAIGGTCTGSINISGRKNVSFSIYEDCRQSYVSEL